MDDLIERISIAVGPRWTSFISELNLHPETKSRIESMYSSEQKSDVKDKLCCKEALRIWLIKPPIKDLREEQQMAELLRIIKGIVYLRDLALELSFKCFVGSISVSAMRPPGATIMEPLSLRTEHIVQHGSRMQPMMPGEYPQLPRLHDYGWQPQSLYYERQNRSLDSSAHTMRTYAEHGFSAAALKPMEVTRGHEFVGVSGDVHHTLPPTCQTNGFTATTEAAATSMQPPVIITNPCDEIIYVRDRYHRYALLDASQRLLRCTWEKLSHKLNITREAIERLENEKDFQERYYKLFMEYVRQHREKATFAELRRVLRECNEELAVAIIEERLRTRKELVISAVEYDFLLKKNE